MLPSNALAALAGVGGTHAISLSGLDLTLFVSEISKQTLRLSLIPNDRDSLPAQAFPANGLCDAFHSIAPAHTFREIPDAPISCGRFSLRITREPFAVTIRADGSELQRLAFDAATGHVSFALNNTPVFGLGEGGHQFDRRGVVDAMRNGQFKPDQFLNGGRSPIPWLISPAGWGIFFHYPVGTFDLTGTDGVFRPSVAPEAQDIFLIFNRDPATILREFAALTGMPHLPPIWALGYQQSHRTLASREAVLAEVSTFREKKLPCDVMIYLGTGYAPTGWNTGHASFNFNPKIFPNPAVMFTEMHHEDMRVVLHVLGVPSDLHGRIADHSAAADSASAYWADHLAVFRTGINGWWVDDGDELLPQARLDRNRMYWDGPLAERPNTRPFSIQRNGYAGLQQFGFLWSGDTNSEWKTLRTQIAAGLNTGLSGIPYWGSDTGGFFSTRELTYELYTRWFQFSAFCPLFRSHGRTWNLRLPWGWNTGQLGPVEDDPRVLPKPENLHHPEVEDICRKYLNLRYQLLPYTYSAVRETHETGLPVMRALWLAFPGDPRAAVVDDAYLWGPNLLIAPVTEPGTTSRSGYLPSTTAVNANPTAWFDFWTNDQLPGGQEHARDVDLSTMPIYVRAGSIIPLGPVKQSTREGASEPIELRVYPGADAHFALYEDDGVSMDHTRGISSTVDIRWDDHARRLSLALAPGSAMHPFTTRNFRAQLIGSRSAVPIEFHGTQVSVRV